MKLSHTSALILASLLLAACGCSSPPSGPCPSDQELIDGFTAHQADFDRLIASLEDTALLSALSIDRVIKRSTDTTEIWFQVWFLDFPGPGGCMKGYAYCETAPPALVDSIDDNSDPGSPESKMMYRHITGNWHLFYTSDN